MGFSPIGLLVAILVFAPSLLLLWLPPRDGLPSARLPVPLTVTERAGQALCLTVPAITEAGPPRWLWMVAVSAGLIAYYTLWARYLVQGRRSVALYGRVWKVPVPMAILPVVVFLATGAWLENPWISASALVLAAGHIPASLILARAVAP
ncbi:hypothetical protein DEA06_02105 [Microbacterium sp. Gd 4-13]|nr:hypothetical protein DEA06_02105 [Microbacterium sp. Gd 4-13]